MQGWIRRMVWAVVVLVALFALRNHIGFWLNKGHYDDVARLALELNLPSGRRGTYDYANGQLEPKPQGRIRVAPTAERGVVIQMDQARADRRIQGMVYSSDGALETIVDSGIVYTVSTAFRRMSRTWWSYQSTVD